MSTIERTADAATTAVPVTQRLVEGVRGRRFEDLPADVVQLARQCMLDWFGVALAGSAEPLTDMLRADALEQGGHPQSTLVGDGTRVAALQAALVNGAASHALDYDDVHAVMSGHPTVPVLPAVLAAAEQRGLDGRAAIQAFVAGFEAECRLGEVVMPGHYAAGWHATVTLGTVGAAVACADLFDLDEQGWRHAVGIAATQAGGFKSMFGTMTKPFHAGRAASNGLLAARLAERGFTSNPDAIETAQGFAATQTTTFHPERAEAWRRDDYAIRDVLFKHHAACFGTHPSIEAMLRLRERGLSPDDVEAVDLLVADSALNMCNIQEPVTALEGKFSLRFTAALALATGDATEGAFTDARVGEPELVALRDRVRVVPDGGASPWATEVVATTRSGETLRELVDVNVPERDLDRQQGRLEAKFLSLAAPAIGEGRARELLAAIGALEDCEDLGTVMRLAVR